MKEMVEQIERENYEVFTPMAIARYMNRGGVSVSTHSEYRVGFYDDIVCIENKHSVIIASKLYRNLDGVEGVYRWLNLMGQKYGFVRKSQ